jgi:hypothetical protein
MPRNLAGYNGSAMKGLPNPRDHRPRSRGLLAFALLLAWVLAPVLHTQFELVSAKPAVEHGHSDDCPRIHTDTFCLVCGGIQLQTPCTAQRVPEANPGQFAYWGATDRSARPSPPHRGGHAVRAPPTS